MLGEGAQPERWKPLIINLFLTRIDRLSISLNSLSYGFYLLQISNITAEIAGCNPKKLLFILHLRYNGYQQIAILENGKWKIGIVFSCGSLYFILLAINADSEFFYLHIRALL